MKKIFFLLFGLILLVGCTNNQAGEEESQTDASSDEIQVEEGIEGSNYEKEDHVDIESDVSEKEPTESEDSKEPAQESTPAPETPSTNDHLKDFLEYDVVADHIDLDVYKGTIQTDNKGNRVILYEDNNRHKEYKSVFLKRDQRLKIIRFSDDGLLYNDRLN